MDDCNGGVALSHIQTSNMTATLSSEFFPYVFIAPLTLLRRLVADAIHHPVRFTLRGSFTLSLMIIV